MSSLPLTGAIWVLDSSAVIAFLRNEPGAAVVQQALQGHAVISTVNLVEILTKMLDKGANQELTQNTVDALELDVVDLDAQTAYRAAWLRTSTRHIGLSLGDRACLALAIALNATVLTADRPWLTLSEKLGLDIRNIRPEAH